jgi:hypothetical protein
MCPNAFRKFAFALVVGSSVSCAIAATAADVVSTDATGCVREQPDRAETQDPYAWYIAAHYQSTTQSHAVARARSDGEIAVDDRRNAIPITNQRR